MISPAEDDWGRRAAGAAAGSAAAPAAPALPPGPSSASDTGRRAAAGAAVSPAPVAANLVRVVLEHEIAAAGGVAAWARLQLIPVKTVRRALRGVIEPPPSILRALGL
jgi:hypothetical protein